MSLSPAVLALVVILVFVAILLAAIRQTRKSREDKTRRAVRLGFEVPLDVPHELIQRVEEIYLSKGNPTLEIQNVYQRTEFDQSLYIFDVIGTDDEDTTLGEEVSGCLVVLADQPWLEASVLEALLDAYTAGTAGIVAPVFQGKRGHPVLIDRRHWPELMALERGLAPRDLLQRHPADTCLVPVETRSGLDDMDTLDDYEQALGRLRQGHR